MIKIKKIGKWVIEYPTTINGNITYNHAFVSEHYASSFVTLYDNGCFGGGGYGYDGIYLTNKKVREYLKKLSVKRGINHEK